MSHIIACSNCTAAWRAIRAEVRRNEKRLRAGKAADMTEIDKLKSEQAVCAARGHHDNAAGARARWGSS